MNGNGFIAAVQLSDRGEDEQPEPLYISNEDMKEMTWRHFSILLKSLYMRPPTPEAIRCQYLDCEGDWVELGSDAELVEALKFWNETHDIVQLQVRRVDSERFQDIPQSFNECSTSANYTRINGSVGALTFKSTSVDSLTSCKEIQSTVYIPTTDPVSDFQVLQYPHPMEPTNIQNPLIYPGAESANLHSSLDAENSATPVTESSVCEAKEADVPTVLSQEPNSQASYQRIYPDTYPHKLTSTSTFVPPDVWAEAAKMSPREKVNFMKKQLKQGLFSKRSKLVSSEKGEVNSESQCNCPQPDIVCLGQSLVANQNPFDMDGISLGSDTSMPDNVLAAPIMPETSQMSCGGIPHSQSNTAAHSSSVDSGKLIGGASEKPRLNQYSWRSFISDRSKSSVKNANENGIPVPMPRNLHIVEGAQSGANAVAIEMPESEAYHGAACNKEEEIAASGGASSNSASEETGEILARGGSVAASIDREISGESPNHSCKTSLITNKKETKTTVNPNVMPAKIKTLQKSTDKKKAKYEGDGFSGVRPKLFEKKLKKSENIPVEKKKMKVGEKEFKKDEESGETAIDSIKVKPQQSALQLEDFVKHLRKFKKDLQIGIVKDMVKHTEKLLTKSTSSSDSEFKFCNVQGFSNTVIHKGITCDYCNLEIVGIRYKCGNCADFDLCEKCESSEFVHDPTHVFLKLRRPARHAGHYSGQTTPILSENIYEAEALYQAKQAERKEEREEKRMERETKKKEKTEKREEKKRKKEKAEKKAAKEKKAAREENKRKTKRVEELHNESNQEEMERLLKILQHVERMGRADKEKHTSLDSLNKLTGLPVLEMPPLERLAIESPIPDRQLFALENGLQTKEMPALELVDQGQAEDVVPEIRPRLHSDTSGSSIVQLSPPLSDDISSLPVLTPAEICSGMTSNHIVQEEAEEESVPLLDCPRDADHEDEVEEEAMSCGSDSSYEYCPSDSDDFCILSPPDREAYEEIRPDEAEDDDEITLEEINQMKRLFPTTYGQNYENITNMNLVDDCGCDDQILEPFMEPVSEQPVHEQPVVDDENNNEQPTLQELPDAVETETYPQEVVTKVDNVITEGINCADKMDEKDSPSSSFDNVQEKDLQAMFSNLTENEKVYYEEMLMTVLAKEKQAEKQTGTDQKKDSEKKGKKELLRRHLEREKQKEDCDKKGKKELLRRHLETEKESEDKKQDSDFSMTKTVEVSFKQNRDRHLAEMLDLEKQKFAALDNRDMATVAEIEQRLQNMDKNMPEISKSGKEDLYKSRESSLNSSFNHQVSQISTNTTETSGSESGVKDADSQTLSEAVGQSMGQDVGQAVGQASHIIQNVASGVSKAATSAFTTAKDVFYTLQAKQTEDTATQKAERKDVSKSTWTPPYVKWQQTNAKKAASRSNSLDQDQTNDHSGNWRPPVSKFQPPVSSWTPLPDSWIPPKESWTPPQSTWTPPQDTWTPPLDVWRPKSMKDSSQVDGSVDKESVSAKSQPLDPVKTNPVSFLNVNSHPLNPENIADSSLRREMLGMQRLMEMGFANREKNRALLTRFDYDLERVVQSLLQEEAQDPWFNRH